MGREVVRWWLREQAGPGPVFEALKRFPHARVRLSIFSRRSVVEHEAGPWNDRVVRAGHYAFRFPPPEAPFVSRHYPDRFCDVPFWADQVLSYFMTQDRSLQVRRIALRGLARYFQDRLRRLLADPEVLRPFLRTRRGRFQAAAAHDVVTHAPVLEVADLENLVIEIESKPVDDWTGGDAMFLEALLNRSEVRRLPAFKARIEQMDQQYVENERSWRQANAMSPPGQRVAR